MNNQIDTEHGNSDIEIPKKKDGSLNKSLKKKKKKKEGSEAWGQVVSALNVKSIANTYIANK